MNIDPLMMNFDRALMGKKSTDINRIKSNFSEILKEKSGTVSDKKRYNKKLMDASIQMEALFIQIMLKSMRETVHESGFFGKSLAKDIFSDMLYEEYSKIMAKSGQLGLAKEIYKQLHK